MAPTTYDEFRRADPRLRVVTPLPFNAETDLALHDGHITPNELFYVRNHFPVPAIDVADWSLALDGTVAKPVTLTYDDLAGMPQRDLIVTLECAGNGRTGLTPQVPGEQWDLAAASTAAWSGVPLRAVLEQAGVLAETEEIVLAGADRGEVADVPGELQFERSLPIDVAMHPDTLLALRMNGEPLPPDHGFPVRLIVPGWYGVASVKWLVRVRALASPFRGFYQSARYVLRSQDPAVPAVPLREACVRSLFVSPQNGVNLPAGPFQVRGLAWSGSAPVERVEVQVDDGPWQLAHLIDEPHRYAWRRWRWLWDVQTVGDHRLRCRATDAAGNTQPDEPAWNVHGYSNNAIHQVDISVS